MALRFPKVNFVMAHMGLGSDNSRATQLIGKLPNLYGDTTWVPMENTIKFIKKVGSHKIMFGSDMPIDGLDTYHHNPFGQRSMYQDYFYELPKLISKEDYDNVMWKTAVYLFKLPVHV
jgi:predicted TIM-barrel fold metal-dependent hydrolase